MGRGVGDGSKVEEGEVGKAVSPRSPRGGGVAEQRPDTEQQREEGAMATGPQRTGEGSRRARQAAHGGLVRL